MTRDPLEPRPIEEWSKEREERAEAEQAEREARPKRKRRKKAKAAKLGSVYCRKGVWYVRFIVNGKEYRESSKSTDRDVALAFLEKRRAEVVTRKVLGPNPRHTTFKTLVDLIERDYTANERRSIATMRGSVTILPRSSRTLACLVK